MKQNIKETIRELIAVGGSETTWEIIEKIEEAKRRLIARKAYFEILNGEDYYADFS